MTMEKSWKIPYCNNLRLTLYVHWDCIALIPDISIFKSLLCHFGIRFSWLPVCVTLTYEDEKANAEAMKYINTRKMKEKEDKINEMNRRCADAIISLLSVITKIFIIASAIKWLFK